MKLFGKRTDKKESKIVGGIPAADTSAASATKPSLLKAKLGAFKMSKKKFLLFIIVAFIGSLVLSLLVVNRKQVTNFMTGKRCDDAIIAKYNKTFTPGENYAKDLETVAKAVEKKSGYKKDMGCVYIAYTHYSYKQDANKSRELLETMKTLKQQDKTIDAKILHQKSFEDMEMYVKSLEHNRDIGDKRDGSG